MEKRRSTRSTIRRKYRNHKENTKEIIINLVLKQLGVSIFLFLLIIILQLIPFKSTSLIIHRINEMISYNMSWDEAIQTVKNTATYIPVVRNWVEADNIKEINTNKDNINEDNLQINNVKENDIEENSVEDSIIENNESSNETEVLNQHSEDIFILEPELGESEEEVMP